MSAVQTMVRLEAVEKRYRSVVALHPTTIDVHTGEFLTLLGPSGSGKTTLLNIISGMTTPTSGSVSINGQDMTHVPASKRALGMVFQSYALMPHMSVFDNIAFPLRIRNVPRAEIKRRVEEVLELVRLPHVAERKPAELSGGQQQRISLARCIVYRPSLILMDEPLGALDKKLREQMQLEIKRLHSELGITMIYVTHDQEEALTMSDRIMLMNGGRIEQMGTPNAIYFTPDTLFAADFIGQSNLMPATVVDGGTVRLHCGMHVSAKTNGHVAADAVTLLLRPEDVVLTAGRTDAGLTGTLQDTVFLGGVMKHVIALEGGGELIAQELTGVGERLASGTPVTATWRRCQVLSGQLASSGNA